tara:strand:+ start:6915 stop:7817 length:903 start_codon:yes stop_codon:yes gene_type:complete
MSKEFNACINILSSRHKCLPHCLKSLWDKWNYRYNYPVYVHYFDDIYDDKNMRQAIIDFTKSDVRFISVPYETPGHIPEEELFYNRRDLWYVANGRFGKNRKGYLHMCHFYNNLYGYPNTEFDKYDYILSVDDESLFLKEVPYNFFEVISKQDSIAGAIKLTDPSIKPLHQGVFDTRTGILDFVKNYIKKYDVEIKSEFIANLFTETEEYFHQNLIVADSWIFKTKMFKTPEWEQWTTEINNSGGVYKGRWGDTEMNVLFMLIHYGYLPYDFKTVDEGYHDQGGLRHIQNYAPSIRDINR